MQINKILIPTFVKIALFKNTFLNLFPLKNQKTQNANTGDGNIGDIKAGPVGIFYVKI